MVDVVGNYCGAHSVPKGKTAEEATNDVINVAIPKLKELIESKEVSPSLIDVFMETNVFSRDQTRRILQAGSELGLKHNFHGDELSHTGSGELAGELGSLAVSHLEQVTTKDPPGGSILY